MSEYTPLIKTIKSLQEHEIDDKILRLDFFEEGPSYFFHTRNLINLLNLIVPDKQEEFIEMIKNNGDFIYDINSLLHEKQVVFLKDKKSSTKKTQVILGLTSVEALNPENYKKGVYVITDSVTNEELYPFLKNMNLNFDDEKE